MLFLVKKQKSSVYDIIGYNCISLIKIILQVIRFTNPARVSIRDKPKFAWVVSTFYNLCNNPHKNIIRKSDSAKLKNIIIFFRRGNSKETGVIIANHSSTNSRNYNEISKLQIRLTLAVFTASFKQHELFFYLYN